ncbi:MAG: PKD domain-containing protein, partial [Planctomycetota bacterium]
TIVSWAWDFGDGSTADATGTAGAAEHAYASLGTFAARLTVRDNAGASATASVPVAVRNLSPIAAASASPTLAHRGDEIRFSASGSRDPDGTIVSWAWDFGDGSTADATGAVGEAGHAYASTGTFVAVLTVTDSDGEVSRASVAVTVENLGPVATASAAPASALAGVEVRFSAAGSADPDGAIVSWTWDFGDGSMADATEASGEAVHAYLSAGAFTATLTVRDSDGEEAAASVQVGISEPPPPPENLSPVAHAAWVVEQSRRNIPWSIQQLEFGAEDPDGNLSCVRGWIRIADGVLSPRKVQKVVSRETSVRWIPALRRLEVKGPDPASLLQAILETGGFPVESGQRCRLRPWDGPTVKMILRDGILDVWAPRVRLQVLAVDAMGASASAEADADVLPWKAKPGPKQAALASGGKKAGK